MGLSLDSHYCWISVTLGSGIVGFNCTCSLCCKKIEDVRNIFAPNHSLPTYSWEIEPDVNNREGCFSASERSKDRCFHLFSFSTERIFKVAIIVSFFFLISYIPTFLIHHQCFWPTYPVLRKLYYLQSVINPIIYSMTKTKFRRDAKSHVQMILKGKFGPTQRARALTVSGI